MGEDLLQAIIEIERGTDRHEEINSRLCNFAKSPNKKIVTLSNNNNEFCNVLTYILHGAESFWGS